MSTVFQYLRQNDWEECRHWLDTTVYTVYKHGDEETLNSFSINQRDTPIHAAVRFALLTGLLFIIHLLQNSPDNRGMITLCDIRSL